MKYILFCFLLSAGLVTHAQSIRLTNTKSDKVLTLSPGARVVYTLKGSTEAHVGILSRVNSDRMIVDNAEVLYNNLTRLGKKKKGSGFGIFAMSFVGGSFIGSVLFAGNDDPCPQCQTVSVEDEGGTAGDILVVTAGVSLIALAANSATKNSPRKLTAWKLEVID